LYLKRSWFQIKGVTSFCFSGTCKEFVRNFIKGFENLIIHLAGNFRCFSKVYDSSLLLLKQFYIFLFD
jgi:hypothetical protein